MPVKRRVVLNISGSLQRVSITDRFNLKKFNDQKHNRYVVVNGFMYNVSTIFRRIFFISHTPNARRGPPMANYT